MRAILVAASAGVAERVSRERGPSAMLPLVDRPFIQHVVETLAASGVREFAVILSHEPGPVETLLGDGTRWGVVIRFHLARDPDRPYRVLHTMSPAPGDEPILLAQADRLLDPATIVAECPADARPRVFVRQAAAAAEDATLAQGPRQIRDVDVWTGWAWLDRSFIAQLPADVGFADLATHLLDCAACGAAGRVEVSNLLDASSYDGLIAAQRRVLERQFPGLLLSGQEVGPGIWLGRNVSLHPTTQLIAPVAIGENCRIGRGVRLGPNVALGAGCIVDEESIASDTVIFPFCYVGQGLELVETLVDHDCLVSLRHGTDTDVNDESLLASLARNAHHRALANGLVRLSALAILALSWPIFLITALVLRLTRQQPVLARRDVVRLPAPLDPGRWKTFPLWTFPSDGGSHEDGFRGPGRGLSDLVLRVLPGLVQVVRGELQIVGVTPRTEAELHALPHDWQVLMLRARPGLITEAIVFSEDALSPDERDASDACYAVIGGGRHDCVLLFSYFKQLVGGSSRLLGHPAVVACPAPKGG